MKSIALFLFVSCIRLLPVTPSPIEYNFHSPPERIIYSNENRIRGFKDTLDKDIVIGGLFAVHRPVAGSTSGQCSADLVRSGVERIESFLYSLDLVNNDPGILPNITLGYDIRDTCVSENIALDEAIELLFFEGVEACSRCDANEDVTSSGFMESASSNQSSSNSNSSTSIDVDGIRSVSAIIGPTTSQVSLSVANLLRLFTTPAVSYSVSSPTFNNRNLFQYFYRTHPSDSQEVQAIIDLLIEFKWTYITTIHSNNAYGEPALDIFRQLAADNGICIDLDIGLDDNYVPNDYQRAASQVANNSTASVVVFFASLAYVEDFMEQFSKIQKSDQSGNFVWIGSSSWIQSTSITSKYTDIIAGAWGFEALTNTGSNFDEYFSQLTISSDERNPWFREYFEDYYNCTAGISCINSTPVTDHMEYIQRDYVQLVVDAVYSVAHALNNFMLDRCQKPISWDSTTQSCANGNTTTELKGIDLNNYLQNVEFLSPSGNTVLFDDNGNSKSQYKVINFQKSVNGEFEAVSVGLWTESSVNESSLTLFDSVDFQYGINRTDGEPLTSFVSQCQQCLTGHIKVAVQSSCCGTCAGCYGNEYTNSSSDTECKTCPDSSWGDNPLQGNSLCVEIEETYISPADGFGILLILVALFGMISVIIVSIVMGIYWKTPIIKSSGREQMTLLLVGIGLSFLVTIFFLLRPSVAVCLLQRVCTWFCFSLILSALFIKLVRITRIFLRGQNTKRPRFIQSKYQVVFTFMIVFVQMLLVVISLLVVYPEAVATVVLNNKNTLDTPVMELQCSTSHLAVLVIQILVYSIILVATNILAVLTVQFPENFNEARYVAFSTFSILLIWVAFLQTYVAVDSSYRIAVVCFAIQLTSIAVLFCLFVPRMVVMIFWPDKNKKQTNKESADTSFPKTSNVRLSMRRISSAFIFQKDSATETFDREEYEKKVEERLSEGTKL